MKILLALFTFFLLNTTIGCTPKKDYIVKIKTRLGDMIIILYDKTPNHKANFIKLAKEGYYDGMLFHRVINGFMIQGGDPDSKHAKPDQLLGSGGPGYTLEAEIHPELFHEKGALCAARLGDAQNPSKASSGSQFYIVQGTIIPKKSMMQLSLDQGNLHKALTLFLQKEEHKSIADSLQKSYMASDKDTYMKKIIALIPRMEKETGITINREVSQEKVLAYTTSGGVPHLDGEYTVFGKVIQGLDVLDAIVATSTNSNDRPLKDIPFSVSVEEMNKKRISKKYGYQYPEKE